MIGGKKNENISINEWACKEERKKKMKEVRKEKYLNKISFLCEKWWGVVNHVKKEIFFLALINM